jgi:hypothetical protein
MEIGESNGHPVLDAIDDRSFVFLTHDRFEMNAWGGLIVTKLQPQAGRHKSRTKILSEGTVNLQMSERDLVRHDEFPSCHLRWNLASILREHATS